MSEAQSRARLASPTASVAVSARVLWIVFGVALAVRLAYILALHATLGTDGLTAADSSAYLELGRSFAHDGVFGLLGEDGQLTPETQFMPLYVLFLAAHFVLSGSADPLLPAITQGGIDALTCVATALIAAHIDRRLALIAGILAALNPSLVVLSGLIYTDTLFVFFATVSLLAALRWIRRPGWGWALALGVALGLGIETRVMLAPWVVAIACLALIGAAWGRRLGWRAVAHLAVAGAICLALQGPMLARNLDLYGSAQLSAQGGVFALLWVVPLVREVKDGTPHEIGAQEMQSRFEARAGPDEKENPFRRSSLMTAIAAEEMRELGPAAIAKAWGMGAAINLFSPAAILSPPVSRLPRTGFYATPGETKVEKIRNFLFHGGNTTYAWVLLITLVGVVLGRAAQIYGVVRGVGAQGDARRAVLLLLVWIAFILLINGPVASPKYRLPIEPAASVFLALTLAALFARFKAARAEPYASPVAPTGQNTKLKT